MVVILVGKMQNFSKESNTYYMINSSEKVVFHVFSRDAAGTNSAKKLRKQGKVVGNIYGLGKESTGVFMDKQSIKKLYESHGDTGLIYLQVDDLKKQVPVLITEYETDPFGASVLHVAFKRVNLSDPVEVDIPVTLTGEAKIDNAVVSLVKDFVRVEALPADLPEGFEIDISTLTEVGQMVTVSQLEYDKEKVSLVLNEDEDPETMTLVVVQEIKEEVEETPEPEVENSEISAETSDGDTSEESSKE